MNALKKLFWVSRPISWINTAFPFGVAYYLSTKQIDLTLILGTLFFLIPYNLLMYGINDVFDYESDLRNPRKGGIEGAVSEKRWHPLILWASTLSCVPFLVYLVVVGNGLANFFLALFVFTVVAYSAKGLRFKEKPFLDSLTSASHFVGPLIYALALTKTSLVDNIVVIAAFTLWGMASHAFGAVQDVIADREGGISSIATAIGARTTTRLAFTAYALAGVLVLFLGFPGNLAILAAVPYLVIVGPFWNITDETCEQANRGWRHFITLNYIAGALVSMLIIWIAIQ
ncbi:MAG: prenyltransferase [Rhodoluna sp.]|nr:prenyltransferase [Rhodoluna sp.]